MKRPALNVHLLDRVAQKQPHTYKKGHILVDVLGPLHIFLILLDITFLHHVTIIMPGLCSLLSPAGAHRGRGIDFYKARPSSDDTSSPPRCPPPIPSRSRRPPWAAPKIEDQAKTSCMLITSPPPFHPISNGVLSHAYHSRFTTHQHSTNRPGPEAEAEEQVWLKPKPKHERPATATSSRSPWGLHEWKDPFRANMPSSSSTTTTIGKDA